MRLALVSLAIVLTFPRGLAAQNYWVGDTLSPRIRVATCPLADSLLGSPASGVMKAELHGTLESAHDYRLASGPVKYHNRLPASLQLYPGAAGEGPFPGGILMMWFYGSILHAPRDSTKPFTVIVDDSISFQLGMPLAPNIHGPTPDVIFYNSEITPQAVEALVKGRKARVEFLGKKQEIERERLEEFAGVVRTAACARAGQGPSH